jgi:Bacterial mobilisation protein (MobC)
MNDEIENLRETNATAVDAGGGCTVVSLRFSVPNPLGKSLREMPIRERNRLVNLVFSSTLQGVDLRELLGLREELRKIGVNVNQLAKIANTNGKIDASLEADLVPLVARIAAITR